MGPTCRLMGWTGAMSLSLGYGWTEAVGLVCNHRALYCILLTFDVACCVQFTNACNLGSFGVDLKKSPFSFCSTGGFHARQRQRNVHFLSGNQNGIRILSTLFLVCDFTFYVQSLSLEKFSLETPWEWNTCNCRAGLWEVGYMYMES